MSGRKRAANAPPSPARTTLRDDLVAGLSVAALVLPEAIAYAGIAGLPPQAGLAGLVAGTLCYAAVGRSPTALVAATSSSAAVVGAATLALAGADPAHRAALAAAMVLLAGVVLAAASLARLGVAASFIARPVLHGFAFGLALTISVRQLARMAQVENCAPEVYRCAFQLARAAGAWHWPSLTLGLAALTALVALWRWPRVPAPLVVLAGCAVASQAFGLAAHGVATVGTIDLGADLGTPLAEVAGLTRDEWAAAAELSLPLALLVFAESWGSMRSGGPVQGLQASRELAALAFANLASGLAHGTPVAAGFSASQLNAESGARTRRAGVAAAAVALVAVAAAGPLVARVPEVALAAVVIAALRHMLDPRRLAGYFRWRRDRMVLAAAAAAVIALGIVAGLLIGIVVSLLMTLRELAKPRLSELGRVGAGHDFLSLTAHREARPVPGVTILRPEAPLFFANAERILLEARQRCLARGTPGVVLSLEESPDVDATALQALDEFCAALAAAGCAVALARLKDPVIALLQHCGLAGIAKARLVAGSVDDAVVRLETLRRGGGGR